MSAVLYKGYRLLEVVSTPPETFTIAILDDDTGRIADMPDAESAKAWLDIWIGVADEMLARAWHR